MTSPVRRRLLKTVPTARRRRLSGDFHFAQRSTIAAPAIAQTELGSGNRIGRDQVPFLEQSHLLLTGAHHDVVIGIFRGAGGEQQR